jgi:hypothetical protein
MMRKATSCRGHWIDRGTNAGVPASLRRAKRASPCHRPSYGNFQAVAVLHGARGRSTGSPVIDSTRLPRLQRQQQQQISRVRSSGYRALIARGKVAWP